MPSIDMSRATPPPVAQKRGPGRPRGSTKVATPQIPPLEARIKGLQDLGSLVQGGLMLGKQYADAAAIGMHWDGVSVEVGRLADQQPAVAKVVDSLIQAGPYAALIAAVMPLAMQLAANHGIVPAGTAGTQPPELLATQMKTALLRQQAAAARAHQEAMADALRAQQEADTAEQQFAASQRAEIRDGIDNRGYDPKLHETKV